jgi:dihydroorotate dehydrogenase electron transfer subunit
VSDRVLAPFGRRSVEVIACEPLGAYVVVRARDDHGPAPAAGQFYMLSTPQWGGEQDDRPFLPRAFSVARAADGVLEFVFEAVGPGTRSLARLRTGGELLLVGPLGLGFKAPADGRRALLVGGGIGIAPMLIWQDELRARGVEHAVLLGFRDAEFSRAASLFRDPVVATDDGSAGHHGFVTDLLRAELANDPLARVHACGPHGMLEAVRQIAAEAGVPAQLALESGMACGFGACFGCVVPLARGGYARVCVDGPVLDAERLLEVPQR